MEKAELLDLIAGCLKNKKEHHKKLYKAFYGFAYAIALRYAVNGEVASIIMNKGFYSAFSCLSDYEETTPFKEWLRHFMVLASIKHYFDKRQILALTDETNTDDINSHSHYLRKGFSHTNLIKMLHQLPDLYRIIFNLFVIEGYAHEKIAGLLNISVYSSEAVLTKARRRLSSLMPAE
jgi:RNA polymerase sigma-70 factor (ECF subfamily)